MSSCAWCHVERDAIICGDNLTRVSDWPVAVLREISRTRRPIGRHAHSLPRGTPWPTRGETGAREPM